MEENELNTMNLKNERVKHTKYGGGSIIEHIDKYVTVKFDNHTEIKNFIYPDSFGSFLFLEKRDVEAQIVSENMAVQDAIRTEKRYKELSQISNSKRIKSPIFRTIDEFCYKYTDEIYKEINYLKTNGGKKYDLLEGQLIESKRNKYIYTFDTNMDFSFPDNTQVKLWLSENISAVGFIVSCEDYTITIITSENLGMYVDVIKFSAEPWQLLEELNDRIQDKKFRENTIVNELVCNGFDNIDGKSEVIKGQQNALELAVTQPITFIWGPPGTGKTETLSRIATHHIRLGHRVLMVSYSNVSVDGATLRTAKICNNMREGTIVRYGYPKDKTLLNHETLTSFNLAIKTEPQLLKLKNELINELKKINPRTVRAVEIKQELSRLKTKLKSKEIEIVDRAKFVATTISKAVVDKHIYESDFDVVIFDEASMAYIPQILFAASLVKKNFICLGDFCQLPPIVQGGKQSFLNNDIFEFCGITTAVEEGDSHKWLCLLDMQYRMHPEIASYISENMYQSLLKSHELLNKKCDGIVNATPARSAPMGLIDLSGLMSVCIKTSDSSRINVLSALLSCGLAMNSNDSHNVGIITPYNAQSRLISSIIRDLGMPQDKIIVATVHQFQGSEKDIIIYDAVDCYRMQFPGNLLINKEKNYANRLFNVAMTRAKGKFLVVANASFMEDKGVSQDILFGKLLYKLKQASRFAIARDVIIECNGKKNLIEFFEEYNSDKLFLRDIESAKKEVRIDIPNRIEMTDNEAKEFKSVLEGLMKRNVQVYIRSENRALLPVELQDIVEEKGFVTNPIVIIDKKIVWYGKPNSRDNFKLKEGQQLKTLYRPVIRLVGSNTAKSLISFLDMGKTSAVKKLPNVSATNNFSTYISGKILCKKCGRKMELHKNKGKFFIACTGYPNCKNTELVTVDDVDEYLYKHKKGMLRCEKDGTSLEAKLGSYGVYASCCGITKHYYKLDEI